MPRQPDDHQKLVEQIEQRYPRYGRWEFSYEHPGFFAYYLQGTKLSVAFTPDHDEPNVVDIQVDDDGRNIDNGAVPFTKRTVDNLFRAVSPWLDKYEKGRSSTAGRKGKERWIIEWTNVDSSRDATVAYDSREEAFAAATDWIKESVENELESVDWDESDEGDKEQVDTLRDILNDIKKGHPTEAIMAWLDYQSEVDWDEQIAIGPSGNVSKSASDFAYMAK